ncbi:MAG: hypothetical protein K9L59_13865 [Desulfobacterales bacterium]|nr:hypothetical protein [Desulfobacterales bacterium]
MKKEERMTNCFDDRFGCFGNFDIQDAVCKSHCALRLRCCIEKEQNARLEILEDLVASEDMLSNNN